MGLFGQIWESSRTNALSWTYSYALWCGVVWLVLLSLIRDRRLRRIGKIGVIVGVSWLAVGLSAATIEEKWRLRAEWADRHASQMTDADYSVFTTDGANRTLGPLIAGFRAFLILLGVTCGLSLLRRSVAGPLACVLVGLACVSLVSVIGCNNAHGCRGMENQADNGYIEYR